MRITRILPIAASLATLPASAQAATIVLNMSGTTAEYGGSLIYSPGSTFTATAVFDGSYADNNDDPASGGFFDLGTGSTALVSFELTTEFGTIFYDYSAVTGLLLAPQVGQIQGPDGQVFTATSHFDLSGGTGNTGWTGSMGALDPHSFGIQIAASGPGNYLFDDPNVLFSGADEGLDSGADIFAGLVSVSDRGGFQTTALYFAETDFSISYGGPAIPEPATWAMMVLGLGLAGTVLRYKPDALRPTA